MKSELVELVGRALAKHEGYHYDPLPYDDEARAAIEALRPFLTDVRDQLDTAADLLGSDGYFTRAKDALLAAARINEALAPLG